MKMGCKLLAVLAIAVFMTVPLCVVDSDADALDGLMLYEVDSYGKGVAVHNYGSSAVDMKDYAIADMPSLTGGEGTITFSSSLKVPAGSTLVLVKTYDSSSAFCSQEGAACYSWEDNTAGISASSRFNLSNTKDDVYLFKGSTIIDAMCYGSTAISDSSLWSGSSVAVCKNGWMMRVGTEDTNTSSDWRGYIPGQTTFTFDPTLQYDATVTPFTFPESGGVPVYKAVSDATESIRIEVYMLQSRNMMGLLAEKASQGVDVDILMEGNPLGYKSSLESAAPYYRHLVDKGVEIRFIDVGSVDRYSYDHAKFAVIDGDTVVVTSENWVTDNLNGTIRETSYTSTSEGNRGWGAVIESREYASFMDGVFENDWSTDYGDVKTFTEQYPNARSSTPYYSQPASWGSFPSYSAKVTPVLSNDSSYAALEYYTSNATKRLYCEQQSLGYGVGVGPLKMLADAASRGVDTRLVLGNKATDDPATSVNEINSKTGISAAVMSAPYVHNKGVIADDTVWVSSVNWTSNSFFNNRECCAAITSPEVADWFAYYFTKDFQQYYDYDGFRAYISELATEYDSGEEITATVTVTPEGDYTYTWDFGDGSASKTTYIPRTTATPAVGTHTLTVTVSDSEGRTVTLQQEYTVKESGILDSLGDYLYYIAIAVLVIIAAVSAVLKGGKKGKGSKRNTKSGKKKSSSKKRR